MTLSAALIWQRISTVRSVSLLRRLSLAAMATCLAALVILSFVAAEPTPSRPTGMAALALFGAGLGLFIVRAITRRHGGRTWAESEGAGKGTTVTIELPRYQQ